MAARDLLHDLQASGFTLEVAAGKLMVTPASALTDDMRAGVRACKPELMALLAGPLLADDRHSVDHHVVVAQRCAYCHHLTRVGTCAEPVIAGLLTAEVGFGIVWPPAAHAATCPAFSSKTQQDAAPAGDASPEPRGDA